MGVVMIKPSHADHVLSLLAGSPTMIYTARAGDDFGATSITENITSQLGYSPAEFLKDPSFWADHIHPDDRERTLSGLGELFERRSYSHEYRFRHKDGSYRWMHDHQQLLVDDQDEPLEIVGYWVDIDERKLTEVALRESKERFELAVTGAGEGLWDIDLRTGAEYWAPRFLSLLEYEVGEIDASGAVFLELLHPDDRSGLHFAFNYHLQGRSEDYDVEYRLRTKSGEYRWFRSRARAIHDETGTPVRIVGFINDITDERQLQATLRETQQILDSTPDTTVIVNDLDEIVFVNSKAAEFGYSRDELLGQPITILLPEFVRNERGTACSTEPIEMFGRRIDGTECPVELSLSPIHTDSGVLVAAAIRDISDRKQLEATLRQAQKVESLGVLAGGIAHDFNNLLIGVLGNADVALAQLPADTPARQALLNISSAALSGADLTRQMLAYSGKGKFVIEPQNLSQLVEDIGHLLDVSISKNVEVKYSCANDLPAIEADASQLQQVIMNLIINASESTEGRAGAITVTTSAVDVDRHYLASAYLNDDLPAGTYVCLEVADNGYGMDAETQRKIFDPFFTTKFAGRGLGLAAVLGIIRGHRGALRIHSQPGAGSTFEVLFPAMTEAIPPQVAPLDRHDGGWRGVGTVLVVDDEAAVRTVATAMIETCGLTVVTAEDGRDALDIFRARRDEIVVVLLDLTMPGMDGEETFLELRRIDPDLKVIISSGFDEKETTSRFADSGLAGFIQKPYGLRQLISRLRDVLDAQ